MESSSPYPRTRYIFPTIHLFAAASILLVSACDGDAITDTSAPPEDPAQLEADVLDAGGHGVLVSDAFADLELVPAEDTAGAPIEGRWENLRIEVGGTEVTARRLDATRVEFDVPVLLAGDYGVEVDAEGAYASLPLTVRGLVSSHWVGDCYRHYGALVPIDDEVLLDTDCNDLITRRTLVGYASITPSVPEASMRWFSGLYFDWDEGLANDLRLDRMSVGPSDRAHHFVAMRPGPESLPPDMWLWRAGADPSPVERVTCFQGLPDDSRYYRPPVAHVNGSCLALQRDMLLRDGEVIGECCDYYRDRVTFVLSSDGWATLRRVNELLLIDPGGRLQHQVDLGGQISDVRFSVDGKRVYLAVPGRESTRLEMRDRASAGLLTGRGIEGRIGALLPTDRGVWIVVDGGFEAPTRVELLDSTTLGAIRSIALDPATRVPSWLQIGRYMGEVPVLQQDPTGQRLYLTSFIQDAVHVDVIDIR